MEQLHYVLKQQKVDEPGTFGRFAYACRCCCRRRGGQRCRGCLLVLHWFLAEVAAGDAAGFGSVGSAQHVRIREWPHFALGHEPRCRWRRWQGCRYARLLRSTFQTAFAALAKRSGQAQTWRNRRLRCAQQSSGGNFANLVVFTCFVS